MRHTQVATTELEAIRFVPVNLTALLGESIQMAKLLPELSGCRVEQRNDEILHARVIPEVIQNMLVELLRNAGEARSDCHIIATVIQQDGSIIFEVHDDGPGVPEKLRNKIFMPHFTTKSNSVGLGLLAVQSAVEVHRGRILVSDSPLGGACFRALLPIQSIP